MAKQYTQAEWARIQSRLPEEDRVPYAESPEKFDTPADVRARTQRFAQRIEPGVTEEEFPTSVTTPRGTATSGSSIIDSEPKRYYNYFTGEYVDDPSKIKPREGMGGPESGGSAIQVEPPVVTSPWKGSGTTGDPLTYNGVPYTGTYNGAKYLNGVLQSDNNQNKGGTFTGSGTTADPLLVDGVPYNGVLGGVQYVNGVAQTKSTSDLTAKDIEDKARRSAQQEFLASLSELGLGDLYDTINEMIVQDYTVAKIKLELPKTGAYKLRFPGMSALKDAGRAISEATYIANERGYLQTLRAYGLDTATLGNRSSLGTYIANEVSPREFEERVNMAATRVKENPDVMATFKTYYPQVDEGGVIAYMLNPKAGLDIIKKQVRTSEIGAAATNAGFAKEIMGVIESANLVPAVGEATFAQIALEFQRARQLANTQRRLAQIEYQPYTDLEAIGAVVGDDVTKMLASERRAQREVSRFGARGGITGASLRTAEAGI